MISLFDFSAFCTALYLYDPPDPYLSIGFSFFQLTILPKLRLFPQQSPVGLKQQQTKNMHSYEINIACLGEISLVPKYLEQLMFPLTNG